MLSIVVEPYSIYLLTHRVLDADCPILSDCHLNIYKVPISSKEFPAIKWLSVRQRCLSNIIILDYIIISII